jgi:FkbM family methyltransferase
MNIFLRFARKFVVPNLPSKMRLPLRYWIHINGEGHENELEYIQSFLPSKPGIAVDVGANEGMFSYALSQHFKKVYAFEANDMLTQNLSDYSSGNVEVFHQGLSSKIGSASLYIPVRESIPLVGWASFEPGNCPGVHEHIEKTVPITTLDFLQLTDVRFIKIDVEGHESEVLRGAYNTILKSRPTILVEVKEENLKDVTSFFEELNYRMTKLEDWINISSSPENYIFVPE